MQLSRRSVMAGGVMGAAAASSPTAAAPEPPRAGEFLWGVATAAHQIEGANQNRDD